MNTPTTSCFVLCMSIVAFSGCNYFQSTANTQDSSDNSQTPIELSPEVNDALVEAMKPAIAQGIANIANDMGRKMIAELEITDDVETLLLNPGLNVVNETQTEHSTISVYLFRRYSALDNPTTHELSIHGRLFVRLCRIPIDSDQTHAVINHHDGESVNEHFLCYDTDSGWVEVSADTMRPNIILDGR